MRNFISLIVLSLSLMWCLPAHAGSIPPDCPTNAGTKALNYSTSSNAYSCNSVGLGTSGIVQIPNGGTGASTALGALNNLLGGATGTSAAQSLWQIITTSSGICSKILGGDACTLFFGYADPRGYGGFCDSTTNDSTHDDAAAILSAAGNAYGAPVNIPPPNCKVANTVTFNRSGITLFTFAHPANYNGQTLTSNPYIWIPDNVFGKLAFDVEGYDSNGFINIVLKGNIYTSGAGGVGSNFGSGCRPSGCNPATTFTDFENFSTSNVGIAIGDYSGTTSGSTLCTPATLVSGSLMQVYGHNIHLAQGCYGISGNLTDVVLSQVSITDMVGNCAATAAGGFGLNGSITGLRCEYSGLYTNNTVPSQHNNSGLYYNSSIGLELVDAEFDHIGGGPAVDMGPNAVGLVISNGWAFNSCYQCAFWGPTSAPFNAQIVLEGGASHFYLNNFRWDDGTGHPAYGISTTGNVDYVGIINTDSVGIGTQNALNWGGTVNHLDLRMLGQPFLMNGQSEGIGIGTATPVSKLDVGGSVTIGTTYAGTNAAPTSGVLVQGSVGIGTTVTTGSPLTVVGLPATAPIGTTAGAGYICVDSVGHSYQKSSCP